MLGNHYDDAGRLTSTDDAAGKSIIFGHDSAHHRETVTDRSGKTTTYEYDPDGNVVDVIDALQHGSLPLSSLSFNRSSGCRRSQGTEAGSAEILTTLWMFPRPMGQVA